MDPTPLSYVSPDTPRSRRRVPWRTIGVLAAALFLALAGGTIAVKRVEGHMDAVTGSVTRQTVWLLGVRSAPRVEVSPLETRLRNSGISWTPSWRFLHNTHCTVFGVATCYECGSAPAIGQLRPALGLFVSASTDAELRDFVHVMESGTDAEQKAAVEAAADKAFGAQR
jgi:hypothetical protein